MIFATEKIKINKGDIVIAKKGTKTLLGYGKVISDYYLMKKELHINIIVRLNG